MTDAELYANPDHRVWAEEFCRIAREKGFDPSKPDDVEWLAGWIANAMMHGYDRAMRPPECFNSGNCTAPEDFSRVQ
jgi:hypothetical protein